LNTHLPPSPTGLDLAISNVHAQQALSLSQLIGQQTPGSDSSKMIDMGEVHDWNH